MAVEIASDVLLGHLRQELEDLDPDALLDEVQMDTELASLGLDSMTMMSAIAELEARYEIRIPDERLVGLESVGQLVALIQSRIVDRAEKASDEQEPPAQCQCCQLTS